MSNLATRAVLASVRISTWTGRKYDRKVSQEVAQQHGTGLSAGRYQKNLAQGAGTLDAIRKIASAARTTHAALTLPWTNDGERILPSLGFLKWSEEMSRSKAELVKLVDVFEGEYEGVKEQDKVVLNGLFNEADYPVKIRECFAFDTHVKPFPTAEDFRVQLAEAEVEEIKRKLISDVEVTVAEAQKEAVQRLFRAVSHMAERLRDPKAVFHDSLVGNVKELLALLPGFNLTEDPNLERIVRESKARLTGYEAEDLRKNEGARKQAAYGADLIVAQMHGLWGGLNAK